MGGEVHLRRNRQKVSCYESYLQIHHKLFCEKQLIKSNSCGEAVPAFKVTQCDRLSIA